MSRSAAVRLVCWAALLTTGQLSPAMLTSSSPATKLSKQLRMPACPARLLDLTTTTVRAGAAVTSSSATASRL